jgi:hypothetical protein
VEKTLYGALALALPLPRWQSKQSAQHFHVEKRKFTEEHVYFMEKKLRNNAYCISKLYEELDLGTY